MSEEKMNSEDIAKLQKTGSRWSLVGLFLLMVIFAVWLITACSLDLSGLSGAAGAQETMIAEELSAMPATVTPATAIPIKTSTPTPTGTSTPIGFKSQPEELTGAARGEKRLEITFPEKLSVGQSAVITLEIVFDPQLASLGAFPEFATGVINVEGSPHGGILRKRIESVVKVFQVMDAELAAAGFDVSPANTSTRRLASKQLNQSSLSWTWNVIARESNIQTITINLYNISYVGDKEFPNLVYSDSFELTVLERPFFEKMQAGLADNWMSLLGITGPIGAIIAFIAVWRANKDKKELEAQVEKLSTRINEIDARKADRVSPKR
jgi:hypothetical protein